MTYLVIRINRERITTEYLHRLADHSFEWQDQPLGRHEFGDEQLANAEALLHEGIVIPVEAPIPKKPTAAQPAHPEPPTGPTPHSRDWLTAWQEDHEP